MRSLRNITLGAAALLAAATLVPVVAHAGPQRGVEAKACASLHANHGDPPTVVLVHGANAESSSWHDVVARLQRDGYPVTAYANPLRSLATDASGLSDLLRTIKGPVVLVGHSYGGMVISVAAAGNPHVRSLVFVDAQVPLPGENAAELTNKFPGSKFGAALVQRPFTRPDGTADTDLYVDPAKYRALFTGFDVSSKEADVLAAVQRPVAVSALMEPATAAAWQTVPSWDVVGTKDTAIPPAAQLFMARRAEAHITRIPAPHASMLTFPCSIAKVIESAAR
jgi:pimeloyl-ACP methyl ester carboxylesterase